MKEYLAFAILGLGSGATFAAAAQALVMIQKASGVINFAQGAIAMYGIYTFVELRNTGRLVHPVFGVPTPRFSGPLTFWPSFALALAMAALIGAVVYVLVMRPLRDAPVLSRVVALVGVLVFLEGLALVRFGWPGRDARAVPPIFPVDSATVFGVVVPADRLYMGALVVCASLALAALYRVTGFGLATRASAENEKGAVLVGLNPGRLALANWVLGAMVATAFGVLASPSLPLDPRFLAFSIVPALAAALAARFDSFLVAGCVGLLIGAAQGIVLKLIADHSWLPQAGLQEGLPLLVIIVLVPLVGTRLVVREPLRAVRLPLPPPPRNVMRNTALGLAIAGLAIVFLPSTYRLGLTVSMIGAVLCLSLVVITGYVGQISLAQMALAGVAGFTLSRLAAGAGLPFPIAPLLAMAAAGAVGVLIGIPALRVRGTTLAVVTLSAGVAIEQFLFRNDAFTRTYRGSSVPTPHVFGIDIGVLTRRAADYPSWRFCVFVLLVLALVSVAIANLRRSSTGRVFIAIRSNERAAAALGIDVARFKLAAFAISSTLAGLGGVLLGYQQTQLSVTSFSTNVSLMYLAWAYLGGITSIVGALLGGTLVVGGLIYTALNQAFDFGQYAVMVSGLALVFTSIANPLGLAAVPAEIRARMRARGVARGARADRPAAASKVHELRESEIA